MPRESPVVCRDLGRLLRRKGTGGRWSVGGEAELQDEGTAQAKLGCGETGTGWGSPGRKNEAGAWENWTALLIKVREQSGEPWPVLQKAHSVAKGWPGKVSLQVTETSNNAIKWGGSTKVEARDGNDGYLLTALRMRASRTWGGSGLAVKGREELETPYIWGKHQRCPKKDIKHGRRRRFRSKQELVGEKGSSFVSWTPP